MAYDHCEAGDEQGQRRRERSDSSRPQRLTAVGQAMDGVGRSQTENPGAAGGKPSEGEVRKYLASLAKDYGLPTELVHAVARTESSFHTDAKNMNPKTKGGRIVLDQQGEPVPDTFDYGVMQINSRHIDKTSVKDADGNPFRIGEDIKTDWRANAEAGVALLAEQYDLANLEHGLADSEEDHAQQAYSGYNAGPRNRDRYLEKRSDGWPRDERDRNFLFHYRREARKE